MSARLHSSIILSALVAALFLSCAKDDKIVEPFSQALVVEILAGPESGGTILNNAHFTFEWRARGGGSNVSFDIQLSGVDTQPISTTETSKTYPGQPEGSYTFTVAAKAGSDQATASRTFTVGANLGPPEVVITGPRGSASAGGSGVTPAYAPGVTAFFRWTGTDVDRFGTITGYRWRIAAGEPFNEFTLGAAAGFTVPSTPGTYTFTLESKDNAGAVSTTNFNYEVKLPTILIVDDKPQIALIEVDEDGFYAALFEGYAFATWDVAQRGAPTTADFSGFAVVVIYSGAASNLWRQIGVNYPEMSVALAEFVNAGGRLWAIGQEILEDLSRANHTNPPDASEFEVAVLHLAPATGDSATDAGRQWSRAGATSGDGKFSFADNRLGKPAAFPRIAIDIVSGDIDKIVPGAGAEIIYGGTDGLGGFIGDVAVRFPSGGTNTQVVFQTFPFYEDAGVRASLIDTRTVVQTIMSEMNQ